MSVCGIIRECPQLMKFVYAKLQSRDSSLSSKQAGPCSVKSKMHILAPHHNIVCIPKLFNEDAVLNFLIHESES